MTTPYDGISALPKGIESTMFLKKLSEVDCTRDYIIIVDRSASMRLKGRWKEAEEACKVLCHHACKCDENGITLYFFSSHSVTSKSETPAFTKYENVITGHDVMKQFGSKVNAPHGGTDLTAVLQDAFISLDGKPLSILVITDGMPDSPGEVSELIKNTANNMTKPDDIYVTIIQVGDDHKADEYLNELDEGLEKLGCKYDIVDVISHKMMLKELNESGGKFSTLIESSVVRAEEAVKIVTTPSISPTKEIIDVNENDTTVTCEDFVKHPIQETTKVATKIASQLTDIQSEMTFQSISDKPTWSDAHVSDDMNDEKDHKSLCTSKKLLLSPCSSLSLSSLCGHLALAVCMIIKQIGILMLGEGTVASLEKKMSPMPDGDASLGIWMSWIVGTVFGVTCLALAKCMEAFVYVLMTPVRVVQDIDIKAHAHRLGMGIGATVGTVFGANCLALAKCMEAFVYVLMTPVRVAQDVHIKAVKLIVRLLENTPGGLNVLKAFNGYVSTNAASVAHDCKN